MRMPRAEIRNAVLNGNLTCDPTCSIILVPYLNTEY
jgi:hypothetical protein